MAELDNAVEFIDHKVATGDGVIALAKTYDTKPLIIAKDNNLTNINDIKLDSILKIRVNSNAADASDSGNEEVLLEELGTLKGDKATAVVSTITDGTIGGEPEISDEEAGPLPDQNADFKPNAPTDNTGSVLDNIKTLVGGFIQSQGMKIDKAIESNIDRLVKESKPYVDGAFTELKDILVAMLPIRFGEESKYTMGGGKGGVSENINEYIKELGAKVIDGAGAVINKAEEDNSNPVTRFMDGAADKVVEEKPVFDGNEEAAIEETAIDTDISAVKVADEKSADKMLPPTPNEIEGLEKQYEVLGVGDKFWKEALVALKGVKIETTFDAEKLYKKLAEDAVRETKEIDDRIAAVAAEKVTPTFKGFDKFLAVLGASLGAYGSSLTGTPNFALNIINNAIDADAQQFLASQEIRTKSLLDQRQAVIQRRTDLLTVGINQADKMLKAAQTQKNDILNLAELENVRLGLQNAAIESKNQQITLRIARIVKKNVAETEANIVKTKDELERGVPGIDLTDGEGNIGFYPGYFAATEKEGIELRKKHAEAMDIEDILNELDEVSKDKFSSLGPAALSQSSTRISNLTAQLIVKLKEVYGMGANFSEYEQSLIIKQVPDDSWGAKFTGMWATKSTNLRDQIIRIRKSQAASQGTEYGKKDKQKLPMSPGMKAGFK